MFSSIIILAPSKQILFHKVYNESISHSIIESYIKIISDKTTKNSISTTTLTSPLIRISDTFFYSIEFKSLTFSLTSSQNISITSAFQFLYSLITVLRSFLKELTVSKLLKNNAILHEILNEVADLGFPQYLTSDLLNPFILYGKPSLGAEFLFNAKLFSAESTRSEVLRKNQKTYKKSEAYITVSEKLYALLDSQRNVLEERIEGNCELEVKISGSPICELSIIKRFMNSYNNSNSEGKVIDISKSKNNNNNNNEKKKENKEIDFKFHPSVDLDSFKKYQTIKFIPPERSFNLLNYTISETSDFLPFKIKAKREILFGGKEIGFEISIETKFQQIYSAKGIVLNIPVPSNTKSCEVGLGTSLNRIVSRFKHKYRPAKNLLEIKLTKMKGMRSYNFTALVKCANILSNKEEIDNEKGNKIEGLEEKRPLQFSFNIPYFTNSSFLVEGFKVVGDENWKIDKWVTYRTVESKVEVYFE